MRMDIKDTFSVKPRIPKNAVVYEDVEASSGYKKYTIEYLTKQLKNVVVGQDKAINKLAFIEAQRQACVFLRSMERADIQHAKLLIAGDTGSGKTFLVSSLAKITKSYFLRVDITEYTQAGYVGKNISTLINDINERAESVDSLIVLIDEIDKVTESVTKSDHINNIMNEFLTTLDNISTNQTKPCVKNILWVFAGSFTAYRKLKKKKEENKSIGFGANVEKSTDRKLPEMTRDDFISAGVSEEFLGRIGHFITLNTVDKDMMRSVLDNKNSSPLEEVLTFLPLVSNGIDVTEAVKEDIVNRAMAMGLGIRGLRIAAEDVLFGEVLNGK